VIQQAGVPFHLTGCPTEKTRGYSYLLQQNLSIAGSKECLAAQDRADQPPDHWHHGCKGNVSICVNSALYARALHDYCQVVKAAPNDYQSE
jgi:hypothetical protein